MRIPDYHSEGIVRTVNEAEIMLTKQSRARGWLLSSEEEPIDGPEGDLARSVDILVSNEELIELRDLLNEALEKRALNSVHSVQHLEEIKYEDLTRVLKNSQLNTDSLYDYMVLETELKKIEFREYVSLRQKTIDFFENYPSSLVCYNSLLLALDMDNTIRNLDNIKRVVENLLDTQILITHNKLYKLKS